MIKIEKIENFPFGIQVTIKTLNGNMEKAVSIVGGLAFQDGIIIDFEDMAEMEAYLGWI